MNTRKDNNGRAMAKWIATPPGLIEKPLRHIGNRLNGRDAQGRIVLHPAYLHAVSAANAGKGHIVTNMARSLA